MVHLAGNVTIYRGGDAFNAYAAKLHSLGVILKIAEAGLVFFAIIHVVIGILLFLKISGRVRFDIMSKRRRVDKPSVQRPCPTPGYWCWCL